MPSALTAAQRRELALFVAVVLTATLAWEGWGLWRTSQQDQALRAVVRPGDLRMISSVTCPFCTQARLRLREAQVPFSECFIERDAACAAEFQAHGAPGTPLVLVRGQVQLGLRAERVVQALQATTGR